LYTQRSLSLPTLFLFLHQSTDVTESSITVPGVVFVLNAGLQKIKVALSQPGFGEKLTAVASSRFANIQRRGRTGRTAPGYVHHMFVKPKPGDQRNAYEAVFSRQHMFDIVLLTISFGLDPRRVFAAYKQKMIMCTRELERLTLLTIEDDDDYDDDDDGNGERGGGSGGAGGKMLLSDEAMFVTRLPLSLHLALLLTRFKHSDAGRKPWALRVCTSR
jgi:hypothetical protein